MTARLYIEGGGDSKDLHARCREAFRKLLEKCGFKGRLPRLIACGGRRSAIEDFTTAHLNSEAADYIGLLIDSEDPVDDIEQTWKHLAKRKESQRPQDADDDQVLFMATCMETWIVADRGALQSHYGAKLSERKLPALTDLESRHRHAVQDALHEATKNCSNAYQKGKRSFDVLSQVNPTALRKRLPNFVRMERILNEKLPDR